MLLREVVIDSPSKAFDATRAFWAAALDASDEPVEQYPEFTALRALAQLQDPLPQRRIRRQRPYGAVEQRSVTRPRRRFDRAMIRSAWGGAEDADALTGRVDGRWIGRA